MRNIENIVKLENKDNIFNFINPYSNDMFSKFNEYELMKILECINNYDLSLRDTIGLDKSVTFGIELEFEKAFSKSNIKDKLYSIFGDREWSKLKFDETLKYFGYEINSPVLRDDVSSWQDLSTVCSIVSEEAIITNRCGGHVHVGTHVLGENMSSWVNFVKLWSVYENIIYRFCYGGYLTARSNIMEYAKPVNEEFWKDYIRYAKKSYRSVELFRKRISHERNQAVNFFHVKDFDSEMIGNTIEFRCPNDTFDPVIWQNYVNLFVNILEYCKNDRFNHDLVIRRKMINGNKFYDIKTYNDIYLEQAIELCDMIFDNNLDKVYFIRQYLKSFEVGKGYLKLAKKFTKSIRE